MEQAFWTEEEASHFFDKPGKGRSTGHGEVSTRKQLGLPLDVSGQASIDIFETAEEVKEIDGSFQFRAGAAIADIFNDLLWHVYDYMAVNHSLEYKKLRRQLFAPSLPKNVWKAMPAEVQTRIIYASHYALSNAAYSSSQVETAIKMQYLRLVTVKGYARLAAHELHDWITFARVSKELRFEVKQSRRKELIICP